jgi:malate dehydrogenase
MPRQRVLGLGGIIDATRMRTHVARELDVSTEVVSALVIGRHSDDMICLPRYCSVAGVPLPQLLAPERIAAVVEETRTAGDLVVEMARGSSAYYAPSAAVAEIADAVHMNLHRVMPLSITLEGEYGARGAALSLPLVIGEEGAARILTPELTDQETAAFLASARRVGAALETAGRAS